MKIVGDLSRAPITGKLIRENPHKKIIPNLFSINDNDWVRRLRTLNARGGILLP
jgi:hypothetical protein